MSIKSTIGSSNADPSILDINITEYIKAAYESTGNVVIRPIILSCGCTAYLVEEDRHCFNRGVREIATRRMTLITRRIESRAQ